MLRLKTSIEKVWSANLRFKVGDSVTFSGSTYVNKTGANGQPDTSNDWDEVGGGGAVAPSYIIPFGTLIVYKASGNLNTGAIEAGDIAMGQLNGDIFLSRGTYVSGNILDLASYSNTESFDPNS